MLSLLLFATNFMQNTKMKKIISFLISTTLLLVIVTAVSKSLNFKACFAKSPETEDIIEILATTELAAIETTPTTIIEIQATTEQLWVEAHHDYSIDAEHMDIISGPDITFASEIINDGETMPYVLYTPSTAEMIDDSIPLIVWLHGGGHDALDMEGVNAYGLPRALSEWEFDGFNAYVVCPQLCGNWAKAYWASDITKSQVEDVIHRIIANHNIDTDRIIIAGHSQGGNGVVYMGALDAEGVYSAVVPVSSFGTWIDIAPLKEHAIKAFAGTPACWEGQDTYDYNTGTLSELIGAENVRIMETNHCDIAHQVFQIDEDGDNKSDLIEWMLRQYKKNSEDIVLEEGN